MEGLGTRRCDDERRNANVEANMCADSGCLSTIDESDPGLGRVERSREFLLRAIGKGHAPTPAAGRGGSVYG